MSKKMLINATHLEESRVAIVEDGLLTELDIEIAGSEQNKGNIYKATVVRVEPGLQAAFVDYGANRLGFLQIGELHPSLFLKKEGDGGGRMRINEVLKRGQELMVQIVREERGTKGAALTTNLSLPGRYMVLMPDSTTKGVSRKVEDDASRKKLKEAMASLKIPENMGYIVRTAGIGQKVTELRRDFKYLTSIYKKILQTSKKEKAPALLYQESNVVIRSIREYFSPDMDEVLIDDPEVFSEAQEFFKAIMPSQVKILKQHQERRPIFSRYQVEDQIETITSNKVQLPSGGSIVIDQTEALVAIDVNSGRLSSEKGIEATAFKSNMEAAAEVGRQLRLRDLGGLIVIDFIDMRERKNNREVEKALKNSLKNDKARLTVGKISQFGLLEMSRQRMRPTLAEGAYLTCPNCLGSGRVKSAEAQAVAALRQIHTACAKGRVDKAELHVPSEVGNYLLNTRREELVEMEKQLKLSITISGHSSYTDGQTELNIIRREHRDEDMQGDTPAAAPQNGVEEKKEPAKKRSRRSRRKPESKPSEQAQQEPTPDTPETEENQQAAATTESNNKEEADTPKPKRRRRPRRRSSAKPAPQPDEAPTVEAEKSAEKITETAPVEKTEAAAATDQKTASAEPEKKKAEEESKPAPKGKRPPRRRPAKKTEEKKETPEPDKGEEKAKSEEKPAEKPQPKRSFAEPFMEPLKSGGDDNE